MNVIESDNITSTISYLRQNVYPLPTFKASLISNLNKNLGVNEIYFVPDQYGGWTIDIRFNPLNNTSFKSSDICLTKVTAALQSTLIELGEERSDISNLVNVTIVGLNNIIIKL